jgi:hypothetical protein
MCSYVVRYGLQVFKQFFGFVDDGLIFQDGAVVLEIDGCGLRCVVSMESLCFAVTFSESLECGNGL